MPKPKQKTYTPQMKAADSAIALCQKGIRIYPARYALTNSAFDNIRLSDRDLSKPQENEHYELRCLRNGFVYILAVKAEIKGLFKISLESKTGDGQAWYIYHFDREQGFNQIKHTGENLTPLTRPYIELNEAIKTIRVMYSDILLPSSLLERIESTENNQVKIKDNWMQSFILENQSKDALNILNIKGYVKDFGDNEKELSDSNLNSSNLYRFTPIGRPNNRDTLLNALCNGSENSFIIGLEDQVGTVRDLTAYHAYLVEERSNILRKYQYSITTAKIIDAYVLSEANKELKKIKRSAQGTNRELENEGYLTIVEPTTIELANFYKKNFSEYLHKSHLDANSDAEIFNNLKAEMNLKEDIPGVNAINKMAYLPSRFGKQFDHLVTTHCKFINKYKYKLSHLYKLYSENENDAQAAQVWCCYMHGFLHGLDLSPQGRNALTKALELPNEEDLTYKIPLYTQEAPKAVESLKTFLSDISKALGALEKVAKVKEFNVATYDLVIEVLIDKIYVRYASKAHKKTTGAPFPLLDTILNTYKVHLSSRGINLVDSKPHTKATVPNHVKLLEEQTRVIAAKIHKVTPPEQYESFFVSNQLAGINKMLSASVLASFFVENKNETIQGMIANDPLINALQVIAGIYAPQTGLERSVTQAIEELNKMAADNHLYLNEGVIFEGFKKNGATPNWIKVKNTFINANTALSGVGALFEYFNWVEANYKSNEVGKTSAILGGVGGVLLDGGLGSLGLLSSATLSANTIALLTTLSYAAIGIGVVLITIAIIYNQFAPDDIESWMKHGFWGDSLNYWGKENQKTAYEWLNIRPEQFKKGIFNRSSFTYMTNGKLNETPIVNYYRVEMQRYLKFAADIVLTLDKSNPRKILVNYDGIYTEQDAQEIKINMMIGCKKNQRNLYYQYNLNKVEIDSDKLNIIKKLEEQGVASLTILDENLPYKYHVTPTLTGEGKIPYSELSSIILSVKIPNYQGHKHYKPSKQKKLELK